MYSIPGIQARASRCGSVELGARLKVLRNQKGLSLQDLSALIGFSRSHISNVERQARRPTLDFAMACDQALQTDGELAAAFTSGPPEPSAAMSPRPIQLPPAPGRFVGRDEALTELDLVLERISAGESIPAVCISGPPGIGKTALTVWWAHRAVAKFPDGVLFADLHGFAARPWTADVSEVMHGFLRALGVTHELPDGPEQASALFRSALYGKRTLIVCDNAANADQARLFLPSSPGCLLLVTSRDPMHSLTIREGSVPFTVDRFTPGEALRLLGMVIGQDRLAAEPEAAADLARRCDHLPLAVRIAAERIATQPHLSLAQFAGQLAIRENILDLMATADNTVAVRTVFSWSYDLLPGATSRLFRMLGLHPAAAFDGGAAAALAGASWQQVEPILGALTYSYLVERTGADRYRLHDLVHAYAAERAIEEPEAHRREAIRRLLHWYLHSASNAVRALMPAGRHPELDPAVDCTPQTFTSRSAAAAWCDRNYDNMMATISLAKVFDPYVAEMLSLVLWDYCHRQKRPDAATRPELSDPAVALSSQLPRPATARLAGFDPDNRRWVTDQPGERGEDNRGDVRPLPPLEGELSVSRSDLERAGADFGRVFRRYPLAVLKPATVGDIAAITSFARSCGLPTVPRGHGYSTEGQSLAPNGIVVDMSGFNTVHAVEPGRQAGRVVVDAGARWRDVLDASLPHGLTPPVLTNYVEASVAGTLSAGGVSGASSHYGTQTDTVLALEVVTPAGELRQCSAQQDPALFDAVRAGYGLHGVIVRATLALVRAPMYVRRYFLGYSDLRTFLADQQALALDGRFSYLEGQSHYDLRERRWRFLIEAGTYFTPPNEPDDELLLRGLRWTVGTEEISTSNYVEFVHRLAPTEALLRSLGTWEHQPHPWANVLLPSSQAEKVVAATLGALAPEDIGTGGGVSLYPLRLDRLRTPKFPRTRGQVGFLFGLLRTAPRDDPAALARMLDGNARLHTQTALVGGASLLPPAG
jgi:cytokinin dehydrogenase